MPSVITFTRVLSIAQGALTVMVGFSPNLGFFTVMSPRLLDGLIVELGVALTPLDDPGLAFAWGLSIDVPLWLPSRAPGRGVGLRLQMRRIRVDENALEAPVADDVWSVGATLRVGFGAGRGRAGGARWR